MKKSTVRLSAIGAILLLGSFAFALAQHDSRRRTGKNDDFKSLPTQPAVPLSLEGVDSEALALPNSAIIRANNDPLESAEDAPQPVIAALATSNIEMPVSVRLPNEPESIENPLRRRAEASAVVTVSGAEPLAGEPPAATAPSLLPAGPPSWLTGSQDASPALPAFPSTAPSTGPSSAAPVSNPSLPPQPKAIPATGSIAGDAPVGIPEFPSAAALPQAASTSLPNGSAPPPAAPNAIPTFPINAPAARPLPGYSPSGNTQAGLTQSTAAQANSDTQRQPMQPTAPPNFGASRSGVPAAPVSSSNSRAVGSLAGLVSNEPGNRYLDGSQNPVMQIQKRGMEEVRVGKPTTFIITVRNAGNATAHDVMVVDTVPRGMRFHEANPPIEPTADGLLTWNLGEMPAGDERTVNLQLIPEREGELGSVASVHFAAQASVRTVATQPKLELHINPQTETVIGGTQLITVTVKNVGTGVARGVQVQADLPEQLKHKSGHQQLTAPFPDLAPSQSETIPLDAIAAVAGQSICMIRVISDEDQHAEQQVPITVLAPALAAKIEGPRKRYIDRQARYTFSVQNTGTTTATNLVFDVQLPAGLRFNATDNNAANYDPMYHTVKLGLRELKVGELAPFEITVLPVERGPQLIKFTVNSDLGADAQAEGQVEVEGLAELDFSVGQDNGTIEIGSSTTYSVQITNLGSIADKDIRLVVDLPSGAQALRVDAPVKYQVTGNQIVFAPIAEMRNKDQHTFRFEVQHAQAGSKVVRTALTSTKWPVAVIKEIGTFVYDDRN